MIKIILESVSSFIIYGVSIFCALGSGLLTANALTYTLYQDFRTHYSSPITIALSSASWLILFMTFGIFNAKRIFHYGIACRHYVQHHLDANEDLQKSDNLVTRWHRIRKLADEFNRQEQNKLYYTEEIKHFGLPKEQENELVTHYVAQRLQEQHYLDAIDEFNLQHPELTRDVKYFTDTKSATPSALPGDDLKIYIKNCLLARAMVAEYLSRCHTKITLLILAETTANSESWVNKRDLEQSLRLYACRALFDQQATLEIPSTWDHYTHERCVAIKAKLDEKLSHMRAHLYIIWTEAEQLLNSNQALAQYGRRFFNENIRSIYRKVLRHNLTMSKLPEASRARYLRFITDEEYKKWRAQIEILRPHTHRTLARVFGITLGLLIAVAEGFLGYYGGMVLLNLISLLAQGLGSFGLQAMLIGGGTLVFPPIAFIAVGSAIAFVVAVMGFTLIAPALTRIFENLADRASNHKAAKPMPASKKIQITVIGLINIIAGAGVASLVFFMLQTGFPGLYWLTGSVAVLLGLNVTVFRAELLYDWLKQIIQYSKGQPGRDGIAPTFTGRLTVAFACIAAISVATVIGYGAYLSLLSLTLWPVGALGIGLAIGIGIITGISVIPLAIRSVYLLVDPKTPIHPVIEPQPVMNYLKPLNDLKQNDTEDQTIEVLLEGFTQTFRLSSEIELVQVQDTNLLPPAPTTLV